MGSTKCPNTSAALDQSELDPLTWYIRQQPLEVDKELDVLITSVGIIGITDYQTSRCRITKPSTLC